MNKLQNLLQKMPELLSSPISIFIFIFLFIYLFLFGLIGLVIKSVEPSATTQLIFGNYTNVLSALGAALAAGGTAKHGKQLKQFHDQVHNRHDEFQRSLDDIHAKLDNLNKKSRSQ